MSEQNNESIYKNQKAVKPKIEDVAGDFLNAERTANMLNLVEFLRAGKIGIQWASGNSWALNYRSKRLGYLKIHEGTWRFSHNRMYLNKYYEMEDSDVKSFIFEHIYVRECGNCQWNQNATKAGYMNSTDCGCWPLRIFNADGDVLEQTKQLIEYRKNCILEDLK